MAKYKILGNSSIPMLKIGLVAGRIIDADKMGIPDDILKQLERARTIERIGVKKERKEDESCIES